jgi:hypothetical protein
MPRTTLDRSWTELRLERGPYQLSKCRAVALAVQLSGAAGSEDEAMGLVCSIVDLLPPHTPVRDVLGALSTDEKGDAVIDLAAVELCLRGIEEHFHARRPTLARPGRAER